MGDIVAGAHQQLGWVAAAAVCAYLRSNAARTRLCSPPDSLNLPRNARMMTSDACTCDPTRARLRCALSFLFRRSNLVARLDATHTLVYAHGPFERAPFASQLPRLASHHTLDHRLDQCSTHFVAPKAPPGTIAAAGLAVQWPPRPLVTSRAWRARSDGAFYAVP